MLDGGSDGYRGNDDSTKLFPSLQGDHYSACIGHLQQRSSQSHSQHSTRLLNFYSLFSPNTETSLHLYGAGGLVASAAQCRPHKDSPLGGGGWQPALGQRSLNVPTGQRGFGRRLWGLENRMEGLHLKGRWERTSILSHLCSRLGTISSSCPAQSGLSPGYLQTPPGEPPAGRWGPGLLFPSRSLLVAQSPAPVALDGRCWGKHGFGCQPSPAVGGGGEPKTGPPRPVSQSKT